MAISKKKTKTVKKKVVPKKKTVATKKKTAKPLSRSEAVKKGWVTRRKNAKK